MPFVFVWSRSALGCRYRTSMTSRRRRARTAAGAALALALAVALTAGATQPAAAADQAAAADPAAAADQALPDQTLPDQALPDGALPDQAGPDGDLPDQAGPAQLRLTLSLRSATGSFGTAANGITFEPTLTGCRLTVPGVITFPGPDDPDPDPVIVGSAAAVTTAYVAAPCTDAAGAPPGTYADTFTCAGTFTGSIQGVPVTAPLSYRGTTVAGGEIDATLFIGGLRAGASLLADGRVLQGGTYSGVVWA